MRLTNILCWNKWQRNGRRPISPLLRLGLAREIKPLELKNKVKMSKSTSKEAACMPQMMELLSCLKIADFDQTVCSKEISAFQTCYSDYLVKKEKEEQIKESDMYGASKLSNEQVNKLLQKWKQPR